MKDRYTHFAVLNRGDRIDTSGKKGHFVTPYTLGCHIFVTKVKVGGE